MTARRRIALLFALLACLAATGGCLHQRPSARPAPDPSAAGGGEDWPRFLGRRGDGKSLERGLLAEWPAAGPPVLWSKPVGRGYSQVAVAQGRLFVFERRGDQARLSCWQSETGAELWRAEYATDYKGLIEEKGGPMANPLVDGDRVYTFGAEGRLRCHRVEDGNLLWEVDTASRFGVVQNLYGAGSTPWVEGELLIAIIGGSPPGSPGIHSDRVEGNGSGIVAFDKRTGEVRYQVSNELASYASPLVAPVGGRRLGFAFTRGGLLLFEPRLGKVQSFFPWRDVAGKGVNAATPVVVDDTVFITEAYGPGGALLRVAPGGLELLWKDPPGRGRSLAAHWSTPLHHRGYLYGVSGRTAAEAELRAVELRTGRVAWREKIRSLATLLYFDEKLLVVTEYGRLMLVAAHPRRFELLAEADLGEEKKEAGAAEGEPPVARALLKYPVWNAPVLAHGLLYVRGWGRLVCFDLRAGDPSARRPNGERHSPRPPE